MTLCPVVLCQMQNPICDVPVVDPVQNFEHFDHVSSVASVEVLSDFFLKCVHSPSIDSLPPSSNLDISPVEPVC